MADWYCSGCGAERLNCDQKIRCACGYTVATTTPPGTAPARPGGGALTAADVSALISKRID